MESKPVERESNAVVDGKYAVSLSFGGGGHCMEFKSHPYYDDSDARDWLFLRPDDWTELEPGPEKALQDLMRATGSG
jgi:hypothetical protein